MIKNITVSAHPAKNITKKELREAGAFIVQSISELTKEARKNFFGTEMDGVFIVVVPNERHGYLDFKTDENFEEFELI